MEKLSPGQLHALQNLARKRDGKSVPFINIADARTLTDLGYAERGREGWGITPQGAALLDSGATPPTELGNRGSEHADSPSGGEPSD